MPELERWVLHRLAELDHKVRTGYAAYDFQGVFQALFTFATVDLSAFYFDIRKDALYCDGASPRRDAARTVLDILFHRLTTWLAPILVFTMEDVWLERFPGDDSSVHLQDFPDTPADWLDEPLAAKWAGIRKRPPRRHRSAGNPATGQGHRRLAGGRTSGPCPRHGHADGGQIRGFR